MTVWHSMQAKLAKLRRELIEPSSGAGGGGKGDGESLEPLLLSCCLLSVALLHVLIVLNSAKK